MTEGERPRLFVAIELGEEAKQRLGEVSAALSATGAPGLRPVRPGGVHLTLKFLGEVEADKVADVASATSKAAAVSPFRLKLGGAGAFPNEKEPRVLWVAIDGALAALQQLRDAVEEAMKPLGFAREKRPFRPHLTVARLGPRTDRSVRTSALRTMRAHWHGEGASFEAQSLSVMRSFLGPAGAKYVRVASLPLGGTAP